MRHANWQHVQGMHISLKANAAIELDNFIRWMSNAFAFFSVIRMSPILCGKKQPYWGFT
jgi:hypothetical protein